MFICGDNRPAAYIYWKHRKLEIARLMFIRRTSERRKCLCLFLCARREARDDDDMKQKWTGSSSNDTKKFQDDLPVTLISLLSCEQAMKVDVILLINFDTESLSACVGGKDEELSARIKR